MLSVEIRVDISGIPHTFLVVTDENGKENGYGFAPFKEGNLNGARWIHDDLKHEFNPSLSTGKIPLSLEEYRRLMDYIRESIDNPPPYFLPYVSHYVSQCATWAIKGLVKAGIPAFASRQMAL